jgi:hypothetical protein
MSRGEEAGATLLSDLEPLDPERIAALVASLADAVADLHARGVVHGRILPSTVLVGVDGEAALGQPDTQPGLAPAHDVRCLGELTLWLCGRQEELPPLGVRRLEALRWRITRKQPAEGPLIAIARHASAVEPAMRPTAREFADAVRAAARTTPPTADAPQPAASPKATVRARGALSLALAAVTAIGAGAMHGVFFRADHTPVASSTARSTSSAAPVRTPDPLGSRVWPPSEVIACDEVNATLSGDLDRDGCDEGLDREGARLSGTGGAVVVGDPDDLIVTGDWNCDRVRTPALLRPSTGEVFMFGQWATPTQPSVAAPVGRVPGARRLVVLDRGSDGCDDLEVETGEGENVVLTLGRKP